jgi:hypothetical protein
MKPEPSAVSSSAEGPPVRQPHAFNTLPHPARVIILDVADRYGVRPRDVLARQPAKGDATLCEARSEAIALLRAEKINGRDVWPIRLIGDWFGISRTQTHDHARKWKGYKPRHRRE